LKIRIKLSGVNSEWNQSVNDVVQMNMTYHRYNIWTYTLLAYCDLPGTKSITTNFLVRMLKTLPKMKAIREHVKMMTL